MAKAEIWNLLSSQFDVLKGFGSSLTGGLEVEMI